MLRMRGGCGGSFFLLALIAMTLGLTTPGYAIMMHDNSDPLAYEALADAFPSTRWVANRDGADPWDYGSAVLIAPQWALTAGHVAFNDNDLPYEDFVFGLGSNYMTDPGETVNVAQVFRHPEYSINDPLGSSPDIAILYLETPITSVDPVNRFYGEDQSRSDVYFSGYGLPGTPATGVGAADGKQRAAAGYIFGFGVPGEVSSDYLDVPFFPSGPYYRLMGGVVTKYDSGGGMYINVGGEMLLNGILALNVDGYDYWGASEAVRISLVNDWIDETMTTVPEPSTLLLLLGGAPALLLRRRRERV